VALTMRQARVLVLAVSGEIDIGTAPYLKDDVAAVMDPEVRHLVLDFSGVSFCDSSGLSVLIGLWRILRDHHGALHLAAVPSAVSRALRITALDQFIAQHPDVTTAMASLNPEDLAPTT
jgi:anti-sigma B factor antagonist